MTRDDLREEVLRSSANNILCELPTGVGKSKIAIDFIKGRYKKGNKILIVIPKLVLIENWKEEFKKWQCEGMLGGVVFTTYISYPKHVGEWDFVVYDEAHHLTERCYDALSLPEMKVKYNILLSATVGYNKRTDFKYFFRNLEIFKVGVRKTIDEDILPDPRVYLIPLKLDNTIADLEIVKNSKCKQFVVVKYADRYKYSKVTNMKVIIKCTQQQYYDNICSLINYYKFRSHNRQFMELYLRECGTRLKWLSNEKTSIVRQILKVLDNKRTLTFCNSILQTEVLGKYCINSKNKDSMKHLTMFNEGKVNHITSVAILDEGMNLTDCEVGVFAMLNSSDRIILQRLGRLLRHKNPAIVIPYYVNTREEEIVSKMLQDYNPELVTTVDNIKDLKI